MEIARVVQDRLVRDVESRRGEHSWNGVAISCHTSTQVLVIVPLV
jgi:hypothetical protein